MTMSADLRPAVLDSAHSAVVDALFVRLLSRMLERHGEWLAVQDAQLQERAGTAAASDRGATPGSSIPHGTAAA